MRGFSNTRDEEMSLYSINSDVFFDLTLQVSDGGVHSHINHLFALITALKQLKVPKLFIHYFGDGRDTSPTSGGEIFLLSVERLT